MSPPLDLNEPLEPQFEAASDKDLFFQELGAALADLESGVEEGLFPQAIFDEFDTQFRYLTARYRVLLGDIRGTTPPFKFDDEEEESTS